MKKWILLFYCVCALLFVFSCSTMIKKSPIIPAPEPSPIPSSSPIQSVNISLKCDSTCNDKEKAELPEVVKKLNEMFQSMCFGNFFYKQDHIDNNNKKTAAQIVNNLLTAKASLTLSMFYKGWPSKEVGYEEEDTPLIIHANRRFYSAFNLCNKASLAGHEFSHSLGYFHNGNSSSGNQYTVPYTINRAFDECCK